MRINEIFYSLQGEGHYTGCAAIFVRLSGCNLNCSFCDTSHDAYWNYTDEEILSMIADYPSRHLIFTGGEPALQLKASTVVFFQSHDYYVQVETNGTHELPLEVDWITCSPKFEFCSHAGLRLQRIDELKVVFNGTNDMSLYQNLNACIYSLQPCDTGDELHNSDILRCTLKYILSHPQWRLSLQTHKTLKIR